MNIHGVFLHTLADAIGSLVVIISALLVKYINPDKEQQWKLYVDPLLSLFLTFFIIISTIPLVKQSSLILMQSVPVHIDLNLLKKKISQVNGVLNVHDLHIWALNQEVNVASVHICLAGRDNNYDPVFYHKSIQNIKEILKSLRIQSCSIQIEFDVSICDEDKSEPNTTGLASNSTVSRRARGF